MTNLADILATEGLSGAPISVSLAAGLWGSNALSSPSFCSVAWRTCGKDLAAGVMVKSSAEKSVAMYHVRRSLAGKALRAGPGVVVEAGSATSGECWPRLFDAEAAFSHHGMSHMLSTAIPGTRNGGEDTGTPVGALTIGFVEADVRGARVKDALIQLAAELANTLPQHVPGLLADVRELCPGLPVCGNGCACAWAAMTNDANPAADADACREPARGRFDDDASAGAACSVGSSSFALQGGPVSSSSGAENIVEGSTLSDSDGSDAPLAVKKRMRYDRLMATVFCQDPVWLTFKDPEAEQAFVLHAAKRACKRDRCLFLVMIIYQWIILFWRPFYFASMEPMSVYVFKCFAATCLLLWAFKDWYIKNRAAVITLWMIAIRFFTLRFATVIAATSGDAATYLANHWLWVFPIMHGFDSIILVLPVKQHLSLRLILSVIGCATALLTFPHGWWILSSPLASTCSILNLLIAEVICFKLNHKWEREARLRFAKDRATRSPLLAV